MNDKSLIIFDKDGTITDSSPGSIAIIKEMARKRGKELPSDEELVKHLQGPFGPTIVHLLNEDDSMQGKLLIEFAMVSEEIGGYKNFIEYPDICDVVRELSGRHMLAMATMMYEEFAVRAMKIMDIDGCFLKIDGVDIGHMVSKEEMIRECMEAAECTPEETVMIGDSMNDLESARGAGIDFIGVTYGFGLSAEDCEREGVPYAKTPKDLLKLL